MSIGRTLLQGQVMRTERGHWVQTGRSLTGDAGKSRFGGAVGPKPDWSSSKRGGEERDGQLLAEFACKGRRERELERELGQKGLFLAGRNGSMCS